MFFLFFFLTKHHKEIDFFCLLKSLSHFASFYTLLILFIFTTQVSWSTELSAPKLSTIYVCSDEAEWPPYIYYQRNSKGQRTNKIIGFNVDILTKAFKNHNLKAIFILTPWKRCLKEVIKGRFHIATDATFSNQRNQDYLFSLPLYTQSPKIFYSKKKFPHGLPTFHDAESFFKLGNICGLQGFEYSFFFKNLPQHRIDRRAKNYKALVRKTILGRCVAFLARNESVVASSKIKKNLHLGSEIISMDIPNPINEKFYGLITKNSPHSQLILNIVNSEIKKMRDSEYLNEVLKRYQLPKDPLGPSQH